MVKLLPHNIPVFATTATANNRVVNDIKLQLGDDLIISRGSLLRESIAIQTIALNTREERLVWLAKNINNIPVTGIIYCLTVNDCKLVVHWLVSRRVSCRPFFLADIT